MVGRPVASRARASARLAGVVATVLRYTAAVCAAIEAQPYRRATMARARRAIARAEAASASRPDTALARAAGSLAGKVTPVTPGLTISARPPVCDTASGAPAAAA